jgi:hypothetical protein
LVAVEHKASCVSCSELVECDGQVSSTSLLRNPRGSQKEAAETPENP